MKKFGNNKANSRNRSRQSQGVSTPGKSMSTNKYYRPKNAPAVAQPRVPPVKAPSRFTLSKAVNASIGLSILVSLFFASTLSATPSISIQNSAPNYRDKSAYTEFAAKYMDRSLLSHSKLLFRSADFEQAMRDEFPEIDQISAVIPLGGRKLDVTMSLSVPLAVVKNGSDKGIVDNTGALVTNDVDRLLDDSNNDLPALRFSTPIDTFSAGSILLTSTEIDLLELVTFELQNSSLKIAGTTQPLQVSEFLFNVTDGQLEVRFDGQSFYVKYSIYGDARIQVGTMLQTFKQLSSEGQTPSSYIDVRVPGKVYIK